MLPFVLMDSANQSPRIVAGSGDVAPRSECRRPHALLAGCGLLLMVNGCGKVGMDEPEGSHAGTSGGASMATGGDEGSGASDGVGEDSGGSSNSGGRLGGGGDISAADVLACEKTVQCALVPARCCAGCGDRPLSDYRAVARSYEDVVRMEACGGDGDCPPCVTTFNPHYYAKCVDGQCEAHDLTVDDASLCESKEDCSLLPPKCCQQIGPNDPPPHAVAVNSSQSRDFYQSLCAGVDSAGPPCEWQAPAGLDVACEEGRCVVTGEED